MFDFERKKKKCRTCFLFLPPRVRIRADGLFISAKNRLLQVIPRGISQREKAVMGFSLTHLILRLFFLLVVGYISTVSAAVNLNLTIYYNDSSISYSPPGAWNLSAPSNLDLGGAHMLTQNPNATASFNFTGKSFFSSFLFPFFFFFPFIFYSCVNQVDFCLLFFFSLYILLHLPRHRDILCSSTMALSRQHSCITRFRAYHSNRFGGSQFSEYRSRPRDRSISSRLACYWISKHSTQLIDIRWSRSTVCCRRRANVRSLSLSLFSS